MKYLKHNTPLFGALIYMGVAGITLWIIMGVISTKGEALAARLQTIADQQSFETQYKNVETILNQSAAERAELATFVLADNNDTIALLSLLDTTARKFGIEFATERLEVLPVSSGHYDLVTMRFVIKGDERSVMQMSDVLKTLPYHSAISAFSLTRSVDPETKEALATAHINLAISIKKHD